jgi:hypothetical protein
VVTGPCRRASTTRKLSSTADPPIGGHTCLLVEKALNRIAPRVRLAPRLGCHGAPMAERRVIIGDETSHPAAQPGG